MNQTKLIEKQKSLISALNPEWQNILNLSSEVQKDFKQKRFLSTSVFNKVLDWKLQNQKSQIKKIKSISSDSLIKDITECYCKVEHLDDEMTIRIKMHVLLSIPWIGIGIGSAIMALHQPNLYSTIDSHSWAVLFQQEKKAFTINEYLIYQARVSELAKEINSGVLEVDYLLWKLY